MADTQVINWDEVNTDEEFTTEDQAAANTLDQDKQPGIFLCEVTESNAVEKIIQNVGYYAAALKFKVLDVIELSQAIIDKENKPIIRDGVAVTALQPVAEDKKAEIDAVYVGSLLSDDIRLFHPKEKEIFKKRRLFVARRLGLIDEGTTELKGSAWAGAVGQLVIVKTEWNHWEDKTTGEKKKNVKVGFFSGYDFASNAPGLVQDSKTVAGQTEISEDDEEFDI